MEGEKEGVTAIAVKCEVLKAAARVTEDLRAWLHFLEWLVREQEKLRQLLAGVDLSMQPDYVRGALLND